MAREHGDETTLFTKASPAGGPWTLVIAGAGQLRSVTLPSEGSVSIGRGQDCEILLPHGSVSKRHAILHLTDPPRIEDAGSKNGLTIRGESGSLGAELAPGDVVEVGPFTMILSPGEDPAAVEPATHTSTDELVVVEPAMREIYELVADVAPSELSVVITGETGVGKDVVAQRIHALSPRASAPLVRVNCAALPVNLFEAELFGHEKGAFTGATESKSGFIEEAEGGTLFLDEVGEVPIEAQAKLLQAIEDRTFFRIGGRRACKVNVRFIAATNRDLLRNIEQGSFRADLYHRLNGITLHLPPLRERPGEVLAFAGHFAAQAWQSAGYAASLEISPPAREALKAHTWPGNIRELRNAMQRAVLLSRGNPIEVRHLALSASQGASPSASQKSDDTPVAPDQAEAAGAGDLRSSMREYERKQIEDALAQCGGNQTRAAKLLGIARRTLVSRLDALGLARPLKGDRD